MLPLDVEATASAVFEGDGRSAGCAYVLRETNTTHTALATTRPATATMVSWGVNGTISRVEINSAEMSTHKVVLTAIGDILVQIQAPSGAPTTTTGTAAIQ